MMRLSGDRVVLCGFTKRAGGKDIGLAIIAAYDEQGKETSIFFLRNEASSPPAANR